MPNQLIYNDRMNREPSQPITAANIVYLDRDSLPCGANLRPISAPHKWLNYSATLPDQVIERCQGADVLVVNKVPISDEVLAACPTIKHIAVSATGFNIIDLAACQRRNISVSNVQNYAVTTVPEHVLSVVLNLRRQVIHYRQQVIDGQWQKSTNFCLIDQPIRDLRGAIFGVVGLGSLGFATAQLMHAVGMQVIYASRSDHQCGFAKKVPLKELITTSDVISLHCSLNSETALLIDTPQFKAMQAHAILINTARGGIVSEQAAVQAIRNKEIAALGFDVLKQEPPINDSPLLEIAHLSNVIISPHNAWGSVQALQTLADILLDNIEAFINGNPQNIVT